ncbi:MAG: hypothetical protein OXU68_03095 [Bacteroidota bacterium]|nr:hypothetical protein [Bacteroidota bacterium]MDE2955979.1 hypothetical protein [Bacteroidota bacterium]
MKRVQSGFRPMAALIKQVAAGGGSIPGHSALDAYPGARAERSDDAPADSILCARLRQLTGYHLGRCGQWWQASVHEQRSSFAAFDQESLHHMVD